MSLQLRYLYSLQRFSPNCVLTSSLLPPKQKSLERVDATKIHFRNKRLLRLPSYRFKNPVLIPRHYSSPGISCSGEQKFLSSQNQSAAPPSVLPHGHLWGEEEQSQVGCWALRHLPVLVPRALLHPSPSSLLEGVNTTGSQTGTSATAASL